MQEPTFRGSRVRHGTISGWRKHQTQGSDPCQACYDAKAEYDRRRRGQTQKQARDRASALASTRARAALAQQHPQEYRALYREIKRQLFAEAGIPFDESREKKS